jgi:uncharacterized protein (UPF0264 family)
MQFPATPVRLLASVTNEAEAHLALAEGADIIDAKNPLAGALGALPLETVAKICRAVDGRVPASATIGDLPSEPDPVSDAVARMAGTGVDFVKVGFYGGDREHETVAHLGCVDVGASQLVGVLFADQSPDFGLIPAMARAGFAGVLLDTSEKKAGSLPDVMSNVLLRVFVALAHDYGLFAGLAGSLRLAHVPSLLDIGADVMGFRGALCAEGLRQNGLDADALRTIRYAIPRISLTAPTGVNSILKEPV